MKTAQIILRIEPTLRQRLEKIAKADDRTLSWVTHTAIAKGVKSLERKRKAG